MIVDALRCRKCNDLIWSRHRHDMRWCSCKAVAIDGGRDYTKVTGSRDDWEFTGIDTETNLEVPVDKESSAG